MKRLSAMAIALLLAASLGGVPALAATGGGGVCAAPGQCRTSGLGVDASWSSVPATGALPNVVYTDTYLSASANVSSGQAAQPSESWGYFDEYSYQIDADGNQIPVSDMSGWTSGPDVNLSVSNLLSTASLAAAVPASTCTWDSAFNMTCGEPATTLVSGTWTATGGRMQVLMTYHAKGPGTTQNSTMQGAQRVAAASGTIGGTPIAGASLGANINDSESHGIWICHTTSC